MRGGVLRLQSACLQSCQQDAQHPIYANAEEGTICLLASVRQRLRIPATRVHPQPAFTAFFGRVLALLVSYRTLVASRI